MSIEDPRCIHCGSQKGIEDGVCKNCGTPQKTKEELIADDPSVGSEVDRFYSKLLNNIAHEGIDPYQCNQCGKKHKDAMEVYIHNTKTGHTARETIDEPIYLPTGPEAPNYISDYLPNSVEDNVFTPLDTDEDDQYITNINKLIFNDNDILEPVNPPGQVKKYTEEADASDTYSEDDFVKAMDESYPEGIEDGEDFYGSIDVMKRKDFSKYRTWYNDWIDSQERDESHRKLRQSEADDTYDYNWACPRCGSKNITHGTNEYGKTRTCRDCGLGPNSNEAETKYELDDKGDYVPEETDNDSDPGDVEIDNRDRKTEEAIGDWSTGKLDNEIEKWWDINKEKYPQWGGKHQPYWDELGDIEERPTVRQLYKTLVLGTEANWQDDLIDKQHAKTACVNCGNWTGATCGNCNEPICKNCVADHYGKKHGYPGEPSLESFFNLGKKKASETVRTFWNTLSPQDRRHITHTRVGQKVISKWNLPNLADLKWDEIEPDEARNLLEAQIEGWDTDQYAVMNESYAKEDGVTLIKGGKSPKCDICGKSPSEHNNPQHPIEGREPSDHYYNEKDDGPESYAQEKTLEEHDKIDKIYSWMLRQVENNTVDGYYSDLPKEAADQFGITVQEADNIWDSAGVSNEAQGPTHNYEDKYGNAGAGPCKWCNNSMDHPVHDTNSDKYNTDEADDTTSDNPQDLMDNNKTVGKDFGGYEAIVTSEDGYSRYDQGSRANSTADKIMQIASNIWNKHGWSSGGDVDHSIYPDELKRAVGGLKITDRVLSILEDENFHTEHEILSSMATEAGTDPEGYYKPDPDETFQCLQCKKDFGNDFKGFFQHSRTAHLNGESYANEGITYFHNGKTYNVEIEPTYVSVDEMYQDSANQWHNGKNIYFAQGEDISNLEEDAGGLYVNKILDYLDSGGILGKESVSQEKTPYPWEDCINDNKSKGMDSAKKICGSIKAKSQGGEVEEKCGVCGKSLNDHNNENHYYVGDDPTYEPEGGWKDSKEVSIDDFRRIKDNFQAEDIKFQDGIDTVDAQTANAVVAVYNGISDANKEKFNKLIQTTDGVVKIASIMFGGDQ